MGADGVIADDVVDLIEQHLERGVVGLAIAVVAGGKVRGTGAFGRLDVDRAEPVTTETVFPIQSVSKPIVATALMQWVERGAVGLDDPVNQHLHPVAVANEWEARNPVTIRRLLTHTAGLPMSLGWGTSGSLEDLVANEVRTDAEPGTRMIYANWGYDVLGYLVSRLAGVTWEQAVNDSVLSPLGMATTRCAAETAEPDRAAPTGHVVSQLDGSHLRLDPPAWPFTPGPPSGALVSNVGDLARFLIAHLSGASAVLAPETIADMHRLHAPLGPGGGGMGLGFRVDRRGGRPFFCHVGDGGGFTTFVGGYPDEQVGVTMLLNLGGAEHGRASIARAALDWALGDAAPCMTAAGVAPAPVSGGYAATYWGLTGEVSVDGEVPVVTIGASPLSAPKSVSRLIEAGGRWRADGGMFDGCELDFEIVDGPARFYGGLYPFEFVADDTQRPELPTTVDEAGDLTGRWDGMIDTPVGPLPLELMVAAGSVTMTLFDNDVTDAAADTGAGWVRARFQLDIDGFGPIGVFARLGLVEGRLQGLLSVRHSTGELTIPADLGRPGGAAAGGA